MGLERNEKNVSIPACLFDIFLESGGSVGSILTRNITKVGIAKTITIATAGRQPYLTPIHAEAIGPSNPAAGAPKECSPMAVPTSL